MRNLVVLGILVVQSVFAQNVNNIEVKLYQSTEKKGVTEPFPNQSGVVNAEDMALLRSAFPGGRTYKVSLKKLHDTLLRLGKEKLDRDYESPAERSDVVNALGKGLFVSVEGYVMELPNSAQLAGDAVYNYSVRFAERKVVEKIHQEGESRWPLKDENEQYFFARIVLKNEKPIRSDTFKIRQHVKVSCPLFYILGPGENAKYFFSMNCNSYQKL